MARDLSIELLGFTEEPDKEVAVAYFETLGKWRDSLQEVKRDQVATDVLRSFGIGLLD